MKPTLGREATTLGLVLSILVISASPANALLLEGVRPGSTSPNSIIVSGFDGSGGEPEYSSELLFPSYQEEPFSWSSLASTESFGNKIDAIYSFSATDTSAKFIAEYFIHVDDSHHNYATHAALR